MQRDKEKEYLRTDLTNFGSGDAHKTTTIGDLFTKYRL